jgi:hypothetical protein
MIYITSFFYFLKKGEIFLWRKHILIIIPAGIYRLNSKIKLLGQQCPRVAIHHIQPQPHLIIF